MSKTPKTDAYKGTHETHRIYGKTIYAHAEDLEIELAKVREDFQQAEKSRVTNGLLYDRTMRERDEALEELRKA